MGMLPGIASMIIIIFWSSAACWNINLLYDKRIVHNHNMPSTRVTWKYVSTASGITIFSVSLYRIQYNEIKGVGITTVKIYNPVMPNRSFGLNFHVFIFS